MEVIIKSSLDIQLREKKERVEELEEIIESNTAKYGVMIHEKLLGLQKKIKEIQISSTAATDDLKNHLLEKLVYEITLSRGYGEVEFRKNLKSLYGMLGSGK